MQRHCKNGNTKTRLEALRAVDPDLAGQCDRKEMKLVDAEKIMKARFTELATHA